MIRRLLFWILVVGIVGLIVPALLQACPACKTLDEPSGRGFNPSIFFMMAMPFTVFALVGGSVFYHYQRANRKRRLNEKVASETPDESYSASSEENS